MFSDCNRRTDTQIKSNPTCLNPTCQAVLLPRSHLPSLLYSILAGIYGATHFLLSIDSSPEQLSTWLPLFLLPECKTSSHDSHQKYPNISTSSHTISLINCSDFPITHARRLNDPSSLSFCSPLLSVKLGQKILLITSHHPRTLSHRHESFHIKNPWSLYTSISQPPLIIISTFRFLDYTSNLVSYHNSLVLSSIPQARKCPYPRSSSKTHSI